MKKQRGRERERSRQRARAKVPRTLLPRTMLCKARSSGGASLPSSCLSHRRRASDTGPPEPSQCKESAENSDEAALFARGEAGEAGQSDDGKKPRCSPSSSSLQRHCLSDGAILLVEESELDDGLMVSTREREMERW